ncbi:uncharacterized protein TNCT_93211 [Trichonephila clavata]|uniref:Uncharacterized protein n=1 Tax=Trichonephila clavata TaxID=2740835 RepID=A0A8X6JQ91_TRICU|nr:uncharacterized protein TNCT_93211 [Trichonephila clavata]
MALFKPFVTVLLLLVVIDCSALEGRSEHSTTVPTVKPVENKEEFAKDPHTTVKVPETTPASEKTVASETTEAPKTEHHPEDSEPEVEIHEVPSPQQSVPSNSQPHSVGRQFAPMYQPMFPQPSGFNMIRRQFGGGMELLGDIVVMGMIGLPILGLLTVGSSSIANFLGFGSSGSSKSSSKRNRRSLKEKQKVQ